ncbi:hypothetical protein ACQCVH_10465 [Bacillus infantis]|jgi:hypothetical protein|uniref:hypothetical protein n=1 Tax=Bacillus infantis TaxID=324767 RepID=UPI003CF5022B
MHDTSTFSDNHLTTFEIKDLLTVYITPFKDMCINTPEESVIINRTKAINLLLERLNKKQLYELLNQLQLIHKKNLNDLYYIQYILIAVMSREAGRKKSFH